MKVASLLYVRSYCLCSPSILLPETTAFLLHEFYGKDGEIFAIFSRLRSGEERHSIIRGFLKSIFSHVHLLFFHKYCVILRLATELPVEEASEDQQWRSLYCKINCTPLSLITFIYIAVCYNNYSSLPLGLCSVCKRCKATPNRSKF